MDDKVKALEKHLQIVSQINLKMESLQAKIEKPNKWRNMKKNVSSSLPVVKSYDIMLHTLATNECQELASKFEEKERQILAGMMDVYEKFVQDAPRYLQWPEINFRDRHPVCFALFQEIEDIYEMTKEEVQVKEVISKDDIQELFVKPSKKFSHYTTYVHKFVVDMEKLKEYNITLYVKKEHILNSQDKRILNQHEAWRIYF